METSKLGKVNAREISPALLLYFLQCENVSGNGDDHSCLTGNHAIFLWWFCTSIILSLKKRYTYAPEKYCFSNI